MTRFDLEIPADELGTLQQEVKLHLESTGSSIQWRAMEDATVGVLRAFGYYVEATARSKDGGIDALLYHPSKGRLFVQVKHSKNTIEVDVLRELVGTMVIRGAQSGLLVTSSRYSDGVITERSMAQANGRVIELVDGDQFLAALNLTARLEPPSLEDILAVAEPNVEIIRAAFNL